MQWLLAQAITYQQQFFAFLVVQSKSKHSAQFLHTSRTQLLIQMNYDFGIRVGIEAMPFELQILPELGEVIDLAVENNPDSLVFVVDRLMSACQINDAQAPHPQSKTSLRMNSFVVRAATYVGLA